MFTKTGAAVIAGVIAVGFGAVAAAQWNETQVVSRLQPQVVYKTVVLTPTVTASPSATPTVVLKKTVVPVTKGVAK